MRGFSLHRLLENGARLVGTGHVAGRLVDLGAYPGAVSDTHGRIAGEVYEIVAPDAVDGAGLGRRTPVSSR